MSQLLKSLINVTMQIPAKNKYIQKVLLDEITTPEEHLYVLQVGTDAIMNARKWVKTQTDNGEMAQTMLLQEERIRVIREQMDDEINRAIKMKMETFENIRQSNEEEMRNLRDLIGAKDRVIYELKEDVRRERNDREQQVEILLQAERERTMTKIQDSLDRLLVYNNKNQVLANHNVGKGMEGEMLFREIADKAFRDFEGYSYEDTSQKSHAGDGHLRFREFTVMVDAKNYTNGVNAQSIEKIKADLKRHDYIQFGWIVSLNTKINKYNKSPIMFEWINTKQCVCYVNALLSNQAITDPSEMLRLLWFACREMYHKGDSVNDNRYVEEAYKNYRYKMGDKVGILRKKVREVKSAISALKMLAEGLEEEIKEIMASVDSVPPPPPTPVNQNQNQNQEDHPPVMEKPKKKRILTTSSSNKKKDADVQKMEIKFALSEDKNDLIAELNSSMDEK